MSGRKQPAMCGPKLIPNFIGCRVTTSFEQFWQFQKLDLVMDHIP